MAWQNFGRRIRALRERQGLTRVQFAEQTGLSVVYLKKLEVGDRLSPSFLVLERIARALKATLHVQLVERRTRRKGGR